MISIHTSAREVTQDITDLICHIRDFNPHFRKGSDIRSTTSIRLVKNFNPHFRKGSDPSPRIRVCFVLISIHTSAREVTFSNSSILASSSDFNPHFRKGSDKISKPQTVYVKNFNPHFRKGSDCLFSSIHPDGEYFNPHFRKGSDSPIKPTFVFDLISIHTSAREVTHLQCTV